MLDLKGHGTNNKFAIYDLGNRKFQYFTTKLDGRFQCRSDVFNYAPGKAITVIGVQRNTLLQMKVKRRDDQKYDIGYSQIPIKSVQQ